MALRMQEARVAERRVAAVRTEEAEVRVAAAPVQAVLVQGAAATTNIASLSWRILVPQGRTRVRLVHQDGVRGGGLAGSYF